MASASAQDFANRRAASACRLHPSPVEEQAIFGDFDRFALRADHFDAEFFEHARVVQTRSPDSTPSAADSGQQRVRRFFLIMAATDSTVSGSM
jgi:hypothetical protein